MIEKDVLIIGGGPSGLCAASMLIESGLKVMIVDRGLSLGGQLVKQTHKFFGSKEQYAKTRGFDIAKILIDQVKDHGNLEVLQEATVLGLYKDKVATISYQNEYLKIKAKTIIVATGASEKFLAFENNDLPGIYGAGAVQTLMNQFGVKPADEIIMIGSGNIGLIVSYQLLQAGIKVKAVIEASSKIGGYKVHASKLRRLGVPIYTNKTIKKAIGTTRVEAAEIVSLDEKFNEIEGTSEIIKIDGICISVGLAPSYQLLDMVDAKLGYIPELGGTVALVDEKHMTTVDGIFSCGDSIGIEEASSAMMEGYLTGLYVSKYLNQDHSKYVELVRKYEESLALLRGGPFGSKTRKGLKDMKEMMADVR
ncbi:pyridine nucleotide-disulfide oxidoreductase [Tenericutes bacterium MZ-XQ]|nr:pyridine nucleotide-disulfide oxidoreductase [Tenericutes bacterium MZ-XQ]